MSVKDLGKRGKALCFHNLHLNSRKPGGRADKGILAYSQSALLVPISESLQVPFTPNSTASDRQQA